MGYSNYAVQNISKSQRFRTEDPINPALNNQLVTLNAAPNNPAGKATVRHDGETPDFFAKPMGVSGKPYDRVAIKTPNYNRLLVGNQSLQGKLKTVSVASANSASSFSDNLVDTRLPRTFRVVGAPY